MIVHRRAAPSTAVPTARDKRSAGLCWTDARRSRPAGVRPRRAARRGLERLGDLARRAAPDDWCRPAAGGSPDPGDDADRAAAIAIAQARTATVHQPPHGRRDARAADRGRAHTRARDDRAATLGGQRRRRPPAPRDACGPTDVVVVDGVAGHLDRPHADRPRPITADDVVRSLALDKALHEGWVSYDDLEAVLRMCWNWPGIRRAQRAVRLADGRAESPLESVSRLVMRAVHLPMPEPQTWVRCRLGVTVAARLLLGRVRRRRRGRRTGEVPRRPGRTRSREGAPGVPRGRQPGLRPVGLGPAVACTVPVPDEGAATRSSAADCEIDQVFLGTGRSSAAKAGSTEEEPRSSGACRPRPGRRGRSSRSIVRGACGLGEHGGRPGRRPAGAGSSWRYWPCGNARPDDGDHDRADPVHVSVGTACGSGTPDGQRAALAETARARPAASRRSAAGSGGSR